MTDEGAIPGRSIEDLYVRHAPGALRLAYLLTGNQQAAEDCVQEAFVRVIGRFGHVRSGISFDAYLRRTIVNLTKNAWRRGAVQRTHAHKLVGPNAMPSAEAQVVDHALIWRAILQLPPRQRTAIVLRFYEDLSEDDIALVMRCRPGTARSLVARGMATLRSALEVPVDA